MYGIIAMILKLYGTVIDCHCHDTHGTDIIAMILMLYDTGIIAMMLMLCDAYSMIMAVLQIKDICIYHTALYIMKTSLI